MSKNTCSVDDCAKDSRARGMCWKHYQQERRAAMAPPKSRDPQARLEARFWSKVDMSGDCWNWLGSHGKYGHGTFSMTVDGVSKTPGAHRVAYELVKGPIPKGLHIDHICHNPPCVNPEHLRPVTHKQNHENRKGADSDSKTGVRGVYKSPVTGRYRAVVVHNRQANRLGEFDTIAEANAVATAKRNELFTHNNADRQGIVSNPTDSAQKAIDAVLGLHREMPCLDEEGDPIGGSYCEECKDLDDHSGERVHEVYPCMTVREITNALAGQESYAAMRNKIESYRG